MLIPKKGRSAGFTLIEMLMLIGLLSIISVMGTQVFINVLNESRFKNTYLLLQTIRQGLVGDPYIKTLGVRSNYGYLGDVGGIPTAAQGLSALLANPGVPAGGWSVSSTARIGSGWNGPYVKNGDSTLSYITDSWGNALVYSPTATPPTVTSLGADGAAGGTGYNQDISIQLPVNVLTSTVHGFITLNGQQWAGNAQAEINYPNGSGVLTTQLVTLTAANLGHFVFTNIPMGVRSATIYVPSKAAATQTIGPKIFSIDHPYYVIQADFFDLGSVIVALPTNLEVPIEMLDYGASSSGLAALTFQRSLTPFNTADYDGVVSYSFEVVATNLLVLASQVNIVNSVGAVVGSAAIPAGLNIPTRVRGTFTPTAGANTYRIQIPQTLLNDQMIVSAARIIVRQIGATKSNIYVPLIGDIANNYTHVDTSAVDSTTSTTATQVTPQSYSVWRKEAVNLTLGAGTPFTLSGVLFSASAAASATAVLYNRTTGLPVNESTITATGTTPTLVQSSFAAYALNFTDFNEFEVRILSNNAAQAASIVHAGLWIKLINLGQGVSYYRVGRSYTTTGAAAVVDQQRILLTTAFFSNPTVYEESVGNSTNLTSVVSLLDTGVLTGGPIGVTVPGSSQTYGLTKSRLRTAAFTVTSGDNFMTNLAGTLGQTTSMTSNMVLVNFHP